MQDVVMDLEVGVPFVHARHDISVCTCVSTCSLAYPLEVGMWWIVKQVWSSRLARLETHHTQDGTGERREARRQRHMTPTSKAPLAVGLVSGCAESGKVMAWRAKVQKSGLSDRARV